MDLDKDGFLSEREFVQGMSPSAGKTGNPFTKEARPMETLSAAEKRELINDTVREAKKMLPFRVDQATTWTDVYGRDENIHYVYRIDMDISAVPAEQAGMMRSMLEGQICPKVKPAMCGVTKDTLLKSGISVLTHYKDKRGATLADCRITNADCP